MIEELVPTGAIHISQTGVCGGNLPDSLESRVSSQSLSNVGSQDSVLPRNNLETVLLL